MASSFVKRSVRKGGKNETKGMVFKVINWKGLYSFECIGTGKMDEKSF